MLGLNQISLAVNRLYGPGVVDDAALNLNFLSGTLDSRITFTRASTATRYNSSGLIETVASGSPRFDYDPVTLSPKGLLIEESRTNQFRYSQVLNNAAWQNAGTATTATSGFADPAGGTSAYRVQVPASSYLSQPLGLTSGTSYTISAWVKSNTGSSQAFRLWGQDNTFISSDLTATTSLQRFSFTFTASSTGTTSQGLRNATTNAALDLIVFGMQIEAGSFATSYIPTTSAAVTRAADVAVMTGTNFSSWYNQTEGTFVAEFTHPEVSNSRMVFDSFNYGTSRIYISGGTAFTAFGSNSSYATPVLLNTTNKIALALKVNDCAVSVNGGAVTTAAPSSTDTQTGLGIGSSAGAGAGVNVLNGHIKQLRYYNTRKSNAELQTLTT